MMIDGINVDWDFFWQLMILSLLKGLGSAIMYVKDARSCLSVLLERRSQYCFELNRSSQKLSQIEIKILCLLLEVNIYRFPILILLHFNIMWFDVNPVCCL